MYRNQLVGRKFSNFDFNVLIDKLVKSLGPCKSFSSTRCCNLSLIESFSDLCMPCFVFVTLSHFSVLFLQRLDFLSFFTGCLTPRLCLWCLVTPHRSKLRLTRFIPLFPRVFPLHTYINRIDCLIKFRGSLSH